MTVKEAPARRGLRSVFAGLFRGKSAPSAAPKAADDQAGHVKVIATETASPETAAPEAVVAETAEPETVAAETAAPETAAPETAAPEPVAAETAPEAAATPETVAAEAGGEEAALPLANYDTLTVASLRARLRNLSTEDLAVLIDYEKAHQAREEVVTMFERRVAKIAAGLTTGFPAVS
jgi:hypothetical protein